MARLPRLVVPLQAHHVVQHGHDHQAIFREPEDYDRFLGWLRDSAKAYKVAIHAYVLMPSQLQLLATPSDEDGLALALQRVGRYYVPWYNAKYGRSGSLFQGRFKTSVIEAPAFLMQCSQYIELTPVRAHAAADALAYPWSSYAHHAGVRPDPVITDHGLYWALGNTPFQREAAYKELAERGLSGAQLAAIEQAVLKGWPLGSDAFKVDLQNKAKRQVLPAKRGRPFKVKPAEG
ncbi:transposase [Massilia sp. R2A-15]|uniref:transposase n=1 Tax=Massilia sp. R2A-15 TaxID=3064278 RepID=UPI0027326EAF|nr:transposase [Massilia sp. R2A-15]WLI89168.1 transposase [Massilia sp. R2A-15]